MCWSSGLTMQQVDAGGDGQFVGVRPSNYLAYCMREAYALGFAGVGSVGWSYLSRRLKYYSCGPLYGCWGVDTGSRVYVTRVSRCSISYCHLIYSLRDHGNITMYVFFL